MNTNMNELNHEKIQAEIAKIFVEIEKMRAETAKINNENTWYPVLIAIITTLAIVAVAKFFL